MKTLLSGQTCACTYVANDRYR